MVAFSSYRMVVFDREIPGDGTVLPSRPGLLGSTLLPAGRSLPASISKSLARKGGEAGGVRLRGITAPPAPALLAATGG